jgi:hypothetical protein
MSSIGCRGSEGLIRHDQGRKGVMQRTALQCSRLYRLFLIEYLILLLQLGNITEQNQWRNPCCATIFAATKAKNPASTR